MRNIKAIVEYDGTDYHGFQRIPGRRTVQGELEKALSTLTKEDVRICGAGRTDAGVHALGQVISFVTSGTIPTDRIAIALNSILPRDIVISDVSEVDESFHARYSAKARSYRYILWNAAVPSALMGRFSWHVPDKINLAAMRRAAKYLVGSHDFTSFSSGDESEIKVRNILEIAIRRSGEIVTVDITANAFLRCMARVIVGTLVDVGLGKLEPADVADMLEAKDRWAAGNTAPAHGLVLMGVTY